MEQTRQKNLAIIHALAGHFASSMAWAAKNPRQVFVFVGYLSLLFAAIFAAREAARLARILLEASIGRPRLVRETSCTSLPRSVVSGMISLCQRRSNGGDLSGCGAVGFAQGPSGGAGQGGPQRQAPRCPIPPRPTVWSPRYREDHGGQEASPVHRYGLCSHERWGCRSPRRRCRDADPLPLPVGQDESQ